MIKLIILISVSFFSISSFGQLPKEKIKKSLNADKLEVFKNGQDNIFKIRNKVTQKWGMYQWEYENIKTTEILSPLYDNIELEIETYFPSGSNYIVTLDNKKGIFTNGKFMLKVEYDNLIRFEGQTRAFMIQKDNKFGMVYPIEEGVFEILPIVYESIKIMNYSDDGSAIYKISKNGKTGIYKSFCVWNYDCNKDGNYLILPVNYNNIKWKKRKINEYMCIVPVNKKEFVITNLSNSENIIDTREYLEINESLISFRNKENKYQIASFNDRDIKIHNEVFDQVVSIEDVIAVCVNNQWGLIDLNLKMVIDYKYKSLESLRVAYENYEY